ncbi:MAG: hypothetical protein ABJ387_12520 [Balneola sp.]|uniref:hypothetical protein n=1 Tax=Balneola sp. EhC07 TaxID=1849360 RepID=UPI0007F383AB|nr:hypothetical protein [Balneola sp. EhC07]OAN64400.1 hypothetical protein A8B79_13775 [Balneola sp. EhC07]
MEIFRQITANNIELKDYPFLKELAMEAYLIENEDILKLDTENFADVEVLDAEIALKSGRKTSNRDGRIDILVKYGFDYLAIVELKIQEINELTLIQLEDYLNEKDQLLTNHPDFWNENESPPNWVGVLVGTSISPELQRKLQDGYVTASGIPIAGMIIRRFRSLENEIFVTTDTFFKYNYTNRDFSKFEFKGKTYNKSRLVNKIIKYYVELNPDLTYAELEKDFPQVLQGSMGVFDTKQNAQEIYDRTGHKRHYLKPEELIELSDSIIATSNQWGIKNIVPFVQHSNSIDSRINIEPR